MRRVVTGSRPDGTSFVAQDDELPDVSARTPFISIWEADGTLQLPSDGSRPASSAAFFPPPGGFRIILLTLWPGTAAPDRSDEADADARAATIAAGLHVDAADGMHRTDSVDVELVLSGEVDLQLDDGMVTLRPGDWVVQNGARHAWLNRSDEPCVIAAIFLGASTRS